LSGGRILYSGALSEWSTTEARRRALVEAAWETVPVDLLRFVTPGRSLARRLQRHLAIGFGIAAYNAALVDTASRIRPDITWLDTGAYVWPRTLKRLRRFTGRILSYNSDYLGFRPHGWRHYLRAISLYDLHVTTNDLNVDILRRRRARAVVTVAPAYDPALHRPAGAVPATGSRFDADAALVGHWEPAYERWIAALVEAGVRVCVSGPGWQGRRIASATASCEVRPETWGEGAVRLMQRSKIGLGLLSALNHNLSNGRTFEIPAIGSMLLAQRTPHHAAFFSEGTDAEFFSTPNELVQKASFYLSNETARAAVARAGHERCLATANTHADRVQEILTALDRR
jgi:spore maturation protein CgeB